MDFRTRGLVGKVVAITGAARGMGEAYSRGFLAEGARLVALDRSWAGAEEFRDQITQTGHLALEMDVTDNASIDAAYAAVLEAFGTVDVLLNNAGMRQRDLFPPHGRVTTLETSDEDWQRMFGVNVFGSLKVTRRFIQPMLAQQAGNIINVVSTGILFHSHGGGYTALRPNSREMPYMASKAALANWSFYLADEVKEQGVAVNLLLPGHTQTTGSAEQQRLRNAMGATPMRMLRPEHVIPLALYLAQQDAAHMTGKMFDAVQWNLEHGLGGPDEWMAPLEQPERV